MTDGQEQPARARRRSRLLLPLLGSLVALGVLFVGIFPTRAILDQRAELARAERSLAQVEAMNDELADRAEALGTDDEIERIAREQYNLGRPGEEVYAILPAPPAPPDVPDAWPFESLHDALQEGGSVTAPATP
jgi:cell division protein FtsB